jgi:type II secretory pathway pseudopilin PulG
LRRLRYEERGFSLLETVVAIGVIFGSLLMLAYTATIGFGYGEIARQKIVANGITNQIMEEIRGLAYDRLTTGLRDSDLASDSNIVNCGGSPVVYRFMECSAGSTPGSGEKIVHAATAGNPTVPLVPHTGTITKNGITYTWATYVTNNCPTVDVASGCPTTNPFRVTVLVTWNGGRAAPNKLVRIQSLFYSPSGCRSTATHPFAAPCQPFFFGEATVPQGQITVDAVNDGIQGLDFVSGDLFTGAVESNAQQEQLSQVQGGFTPVGVRIVDGAGTRTAGAVAETTTAADADPGSTTVSAYQSASLTPPVSASTLTTPSGGGTTQIAFTSPAGDTARSDSTTSAAGSNVCPPPADTAETDQKPCGGSRQQQGGNLTSVLTLSGTTPSLGTATLAQVGVAASLPNKSFVNRVLSPTSALCTPAVDADGCLEQTATRAFGTVNIGALPSVITAPAGWNGANAWNGYYLSLVSYQDSAQVAVGRPAVPPAVTPTVPAPSASVSSGTIHYWNGTGYTSLAATAAGLNTLNVSSAFVQVISGHTITITIGTVNGTTAAATSASSPAAAAASMTEASAQVTPPKATISYQVNIDGTDVVDLQITLNLKQAEARAVYAPAPVQGS